MKFSLASLVVQRWSVSILPFWQETICPHSSKKFKLNKDQTEAIRFSSSSVNTTVQHLQSLWTIPIDVGFAGIVPNLGFIFDSDLSMKQHIIKTCKAAYVQIRHISCIRQYRTRDATKTLVNSCILSRLDYCNSQLAGYISTGSHQTTPTITELLRQTRS